MTPDTEHDPARSQPAPDQSAGRRWFRVKISLTWLVLLTLIGFGASRLHLDFGLIGQKLPFLLGLRLAPDGFIQGAALTVFVTAASMPCALLLGTLAALGRLSANPIAFAVSTFYGSLFRGTPLIVQVLIIYLALPQIGIILGGLTSGIIALSFNYGAYLSEMIRSGVMSVAPGQREAAMALGLPNWVISWKVIAPQALRVIIPPAGTQFVSMLKDSSLVSLLGLWELNFLAQAYGREGNDYFEMLLSAAVIYWMLSVLFELVQFRLERKFGKGATAPGRST